MAHWRGTLMIGGLLAAVVLSPTARAADGRISFSGMIVEPTCAVSADAMAQIASSGVSPTQGSRGSCGQGRNADTGSRYAQVMSILMAGQQADQLLSYFAGNAQASGATARLLTQTYE